MTLLWVLPHHIPILYFLDNLEASLNLKIEQQREENDPESRAEESEIVFATLPPLQKSRPPALPVPASSTAATQRPPRRGTACCRFVQKCTRSYIGYYDTAGFHSICHIDIPASNITLADPAASGWGSWAMLPVMISLTQPSRSSCGSNDT